MELLIWALTSEQDGGEGFSDRRGLVFHDNSTCSDDMFWHENPITSKITLRPAVEMQFNVLDELSDGRKVFGSVIELSRKLLTIDSWDRPTAWQTYQWLDAIMKEAREDLDYDPFKYCRSESREAVGPQLAPATQYLTTDSTKRGESSATSAGSSGSKNRQVRLPIASSIEDKIEASTHSESQLPALAQPLLVTAQGSALHEELQ
jgi:hypothetical protein